MKAMSDHFIISNKEGTESCDCVVIKLEIDFDVHCAANALWQLCSLDKSFTFWWLFCNMTHLFFCTSFFVSPLFYYLRGSCIYSKCSDFTDLL